MKHNRFIVVLSIIGLAALFIMLNFTSPTEIGPFGVLLFFTTLYITIFSITAVIKQLFLSLAYKKTSMRGKDYLYSAVFAFGPIMLLMACSFGAVNLWTITLIALFVFLAEFLVAKRM